MVNNMWKAIVLKATKEKELKKEEIILKELECEIMCVFVPCKNKLKRKERKKVEKLLLHEEFVFTNDKELKIYEKGVIINSWLNFFTIEALMFLFENKNLSDVAIVTATLNPLFKKVLLELSEIYRVVNIYTVLKDELQEYFDDLYSSIGLPVFINELTPDTVPKERYIIRVADNITIYDSVKNKEMIDIKLDYLYPLSKYKELPIVEIIKSGLFYKNLNIDSLKGMVKIVGEISK